MYLNTNTLEGYKYNYKYYEMQKYLNTLESILNTFSKYFWCGLIGMLEGQSSSSNVANKDSWKLDMGKGEYSG